jgi:hypothetical protein
MGEVVRFRKPKPGEKHKGKGLCQSGFHKWSADGETRFDVKLGRLVTRLVCERCGATRVEAR